MAAAKIRNLLYTFGKNNTMKTILYLLSFFVITLTACNNDPKNVATSKAIDVVKESNLADLSTATDIKKLLCQNWENREDAEDAALSGTGDGLELPYRGFSIFEDATVVENPRDKMRFGKWNLNEADKMISIEFKNGAKAQYKIVDISGQKMVLMNAADKKKTEYKADAKMQKNMADDPFYEANNRWRIKPAVSESDSAIKLRAAQCVLFYAKFLKDNADRGANIISFAGLPNCFNWYRGGVSVMGKDKLSNKWLNCFYNNDQAYKAHAMLEKMITKKYKWNKEETNWVKQSADVVLQMYDTIKAL